MILQRMENRGHVLLENCKNSNLTSVFHPLCVMQNHFCKEQIHDCQGTSFKVRSSGSYDLTRSFFTELHQFQLSTIFLSVQSFAKQNSLFERENYSTKCPNSFPRVNDKCFLEKLWKPNVWSLFCLFYRHFASKFEKLKNNWTSEVKQRCTFTLFYRYFTLRFFSKSKSSLTIFVEIKKLILYVSTQKKSVAITSWFCRNFVINHL